MLNEVREEQGRTKQAMMRHIGVTAPTYDKYEADPLSMPLGCAVRLAAFLHVSLAAIYKPGRID